MNSEVNMDLLISLSMFVRSLRDPFKVGQLLFSSSILRVIEITFLSGRVAAGCTPQETLSTKDLCSCPVALCA